MGKDYTIRFLPSAKRDLERMKRYILEKFMYPQYGVNFDSKIKDAVARIKKAPVSYKSTEITYRGYKVFMRCINTYLFFYMVDGKMISILRVLKDGMNWQYLIKSWVKQNE